MKKLLVGLILVIIGLGVSYQVYKLYQRSQHREKKLEVKVPVKVSKVQHRQMTWKLNLIGNIKPKQEVNVYPKIAGEILEKLLVEKGDRVKKGQLMGVIEKETITAKLNQAKAALNAARANLAQIEANLKSIEKDYKRIKRLYNEKAVSKQRLDHITAQYDATLAAKKSALAQIKQAEATLKEVQIRYHDHTIYAPISGVITARYVDEGAMMDIKKPIVRITDDSIVKVNVAINEKDLPYVKIGQIAYIKVDAYPDKVFKGEVKVINPRIHPATRTALIEIHIQNPKRLLKAGMFAHVNLILGKKLVLAVPKDALQKMPATGVYYLFVVDKDKIAHMRNVKTGISEGNFVEIIKGLKRGELVVTYGQNRLKEGLAVEIVGEET